MRFSLKLACKHGISRSKCQFQLGRGTMIPHGTVMIPIVFVVELMHINEWAGLNVKNLNMQFLDNCM